MESHRNSGTQTDANVASQHESSNAVDSEMPRRHWDPPALKRVWEAPTLTSIPLDAAETGINFGPEILVLLG